MHTATCGKYSARETHCLVDRWQCARRPLHRALFLESELSIRIAHPLSSGYSIRLDIRVNDLLRPTPPCITMSGIPFDRALQTFFKRDILVSSQRSELRHIHRASKIIVRSSRPPVDPGFYIGAVVARRLDSLKKSLT